MKRTIYFGVFFVLFANSCKTIMQQPISNNANTIEELPKQTTVPIFGDSRTTSASFPGGVESMLNFINTNKRYPQVDSLAGKRGTVFVQFGLKGQNLG